MIYFSFGPEMKGPAGNRSERLSLDETNQGRNLNFDNIYRNTASAVSMNMGILTTIYLVFHIIKFLYF